MQKKNNRIKLWLQINPDVLNKVGPNLFKWQKMPANTQQFRNLCYNIRRSIWEFNSYRCHQMTKKGRRGILYEIADPFIRQGLAQQRWDRIHHKSIPRGMRVSGQHPYSRRSDHIDRIAKEHRESISAPWGVVTECRMIRPRDGVYRFWWTLFFWLNLSVSCVIL